MRDKLSNFSGLDNESPSAFSARVTREGRSHGITRTRGRNTGRRRIVYRRMGVLALAIAVPAVAAPVIDRAPQPQVIRFVMPETIPYDPTPPALRDIESYASPYAPLDTLGLSENTYDIGPAARPFIGGANGTDRLRAQQCLTLSVYYEAASEADEGQRAVAQVVMNRVRHPSYPNSVCGVVFQGSDRSTGCQFSFTCDGSLSRRPERGAWARASHVASAAMGGFVDRGVGLSTHYHTVNVNPYWASSLDHVTTIGLHRFYRWSGSAGQPAAFDANYGGNEPLPAPNVRQVGSGATSAVVPIPSFAPNSPSAQAPATAAEVENPTTPNNLPQSGAVLEQYSQSGSWLDEPGQ